MTNTISIDAINDAVKEVNEILKKHEGNTAYDVYDKAVRDTAEVFRKYAEIYRNKM